MRVWRDYTQKDNHRLATSWQSVQGHKPGSRSISAVVDWHQLSGYLVRQAFPSLYFDEWTMFVDVCVYESYS